MDTRFGYLAVPRYGSGNESNGSASAGGMRDLTAGKLTLELSDRIADVRGELWPTHLGHSELKTAPRKAVGRQLSRVTLTNGEDSSIYRIPIRHESSETSVVLCAFKTPLDEGPSGHSRISAIVYLTLGALVASTRERLVEQTYILALSTVMTGLVGISRVALGVHLATDVVAGWAFGAAWAMGWLLLAARIVRTGTP